MILRNHGQLSSKQIAEELLRQSAVLHQHAAYIAELEERIAVAERRFNVPSHQIHEAIDAGVLEETPEVCDWIMDVDLLERSRLNAARR